MKWTMEDYNRLRERSNSGQMKFLTLYELSGLFHHVYALARSLKDIRPPSCWSSSELMPC